ncbi:unnamed protein product, partial [Nesidiocoris tenuis]
QDRGRVANRGNRPDRTDRGRDRPENIRGRRATRDRAVTLAAAPTRQDGIARIRAVRCRTGNAIRAAGYYGSSSRSRYRSPSPYYSSRRRSRYDRSRSRSYSPLNNYVQRRSAHIRPKHLGWQMQAKWARLFQDAREAERLKNKAEVNQLIAYEETKLWATITKEREHADVVLYEVVKYNKNQLISLNDEIALLGDKFAEACKQRDERIDDIEAWKCVLRDLFGEFQKFITFVLNEIPGQAGYLLSLTEIMDKRKECLPRLLKYAQFMEKCIPETLIHTRDAHLEAESKTIREKRTPTADGAENTIEANNEDTSPGPFVSERINSILNILDAHPHLKSAITGS